MQGHFLAPKGACPPTTLDGGGDLDFSCGIGGAAPVNPRSRSPREGGVFFMVLLACAWCLRVFFLLFIVFSFLPSSFLGFHRPFRGCWAFFGWLSFAAALVFSLLPPAGGGLAHRFAVVIAFFSGVFYRRLGVFSRRLGVFYRYKGLFFLAFFRFFS